MAGMFFSDERIATTIRRNLAERGMTMTDLAMRTMSPYRSVQNYLSGRCRIPATFALDCAFLLGIGNQEFVDEKPTAAGRLATIERLNARRSASVLGGKS